MKKLVCLILALILPFSLMASGSVASTSWVAGFMDLAGVDDVVTIAPATLRHPPEYELTPSDIVTVMNADIFCYAGYERMMGVISSSLVNPERKDMKIKTENRLSNVLDMTALIAEAAGTTPRTDEYKAVVEEGRKFVEENDLASLRVLCHAMQTPLAEDLGLNVVKTFGSAPMTAEQIRDASENDYDLVIDNVHNPVAGPVKEVSDAVIVVWRNFPDKTGRGALTGVVEANIEALKDAIKL